MIFSTEMKAKSGVGYIWVPGLSGTRTRRRTIAGFFSFVLLCLRSFGLYLASLALGLRTLVGTGLRLTAFKELPA